VRLFNVSFLLSVSCAVAPTPAPSAPAAGVPEPLRLVFVDDFNPPRPPRPEPPPPPEPRWDAALGGLSGLYYDAADGLLYAVSDDTKYFGTRLYTFALELTETELRVLPRAVVSLEEPVPSGALLQLDAESLTSVPGGSFWIGTENNDERATQRWPRILRIERDGRVSGSLPLPEAFLPEPEGVPTRGTRTNLAFEGLALSPSGVWLAAITETALRQDGPPADLEHGTTARLLRWDLRNSSPPAQFTYPIEPAPRPADGSSPGTVLNGASELLSLDDERLLVLERAYVAPAGAHGRNTVRIFEVSLPASSAAGTTSSS